ncbi:hypothetical protein PFISCL1PPCAC_2444, partial [Pristionchus fissidentatus]
SLMESNCYLAEDLYNMLKLHVLQWVHLVFSYTSIILCIYTCCKYINKSLFESATKELVIAVYAFCIIHATSIGTVQVFHLVSRYSAIVPCDAQIPKRFCILRLVVSSTVPGFCILHIGITAQRIQSTFGCCLWKQKFTARSFIIAYSCIFGYLAFHNEPMDGLSAYCTSFTKSTETVMMLNLFVMVVSDVMNFVATLGLWWYNVAKLKKERKECIVNKTFHRIQCIYSIKQFLPVTVIHTVSYIVMFSKFAILLQIINRIETNQVMPYYCLLAPLILLILIRLGRFERNTALRGHTDPEKREENK